jgi:hypothetical protein
MVTKNKSSKQKSSTKIMESSTQIRLSLFGITVLKHNFVELKRKTQLKLYGRTTGVRQDKV